MKGAKIAELIIEWASENNIHPDDFDMWFAGELLEALEEDE